MKQGVLLFAHNNEQINYGQMAWWSAARIRKHLGVGTSIVTDLATVESMDAIDPNWKSRFDKIILQESSATQTKRYGSPDNQLTFHNLDRLDAWSVTPYEETIVMDADLVIQTSALSRLWGNEQDLIVCETSTDLNGITDEEFTWISERSIKFYWATVFYFKKTDFTELFFRQCNWVKKNYGWMSYIYEISPSPVRNDFIWSIALHSLGHPAETIPFNIMHSNFEDTIVDMNSSAIKFLTDQGLRKVESDVHILNKFNLLEQIQKGIV